MRRALLRAIWWAALRLTRLLCPAPDLPPPGRWDTRLTPSAPHRVWLVWLPAPNSYTRWHVVMVVDDAPAWIINPGWTGLDITTVHEPKKWVRRLGAPWVVQVWLDLNTVDRPLLPELMTCVTIPKAFLGVDAPEVQTPEQLLAWCWERRQDEQGC